MSNFDRLHKLVDQIKESNMAKTQLNDLDREYKVLLAEANYKSNRTL